MLRHHQIAIIYYLNKIIVESPIEATKRYPKVDTRWPLVFAEVGVRDGDSAAVILDTFPSMQYYAIDLWDKESQKQQRAYKEFRARTGNHRDRITEIHGYSYDVADQIPDNSLDMCFIDADHHYESVIRDINAYWPKVKKGGIISGHDIDDAKTPGVRKAVEEFYAEIYGKIEKPFATNLGYTLSPRNSLVTDMGHTWFMEKCAHDS
jgi:predicted O-methyltransferase YrrM